jgi:hypothetical protein
MGQLMNHNVGRGEKVERTRRGIVKGFAGAIVPLVLLLSIVGFAHNAPGALADTGKFTEKDLNGTFAFSADGTLYPAFPALSPAWPAVAVGLFTFDGAGGCSVVDQLNVGTLGLVPPAGFRTSTSCQYSVNPDGTGTLETSFGGDPGDINGPGRLTFAIVGKGPVTEIRFTRVDPGAVATGVARQQ